MHVYFEEDCYYSHTSNSDNRFTIIMITSQRRVGLVNLLDHKSCFKQSSYYIKAKTFDLCMIVTVTIKQAKRTQSHVLY